MDPQLPPHCMSSSILPATLSKQRKDLFAKWKKPVLDALVPSGSEDASIPIDLNKFLALLQLFASSPKNYSGMRVHFATGLDQSGSPSVPSGREGKVTLIAAPTVQSTEPYAPDDPGSYYHLYDKVDALLPGIVTAWINHYRYARWEKMLTDGKRADRAGASFRESFSLWFPMSTLKGIAPDPNVPGSGDIGMIKAIQCGMADPTNPIIGLSADFACFLPKEGSPVKFPHYQLTVSFNLHQQQDPVHPLTFGSGSFNLLLLADADTGLPCPPNGVC